MSEYPYAGSYRDRHGKVRWRYRRNGKVTQLPGTPGEPAFEAAYKACIEGRPVEKGQVHHLPTAASPKSFKAAWQILKKDDPEWRLLDATTILDQTRVIERFLDSTVVKGEPLTWGDVAVEHLQRRHVKALLAARSDKPHAAKHLLGAIRKLVTIALDQEWIEVDPTYRVKHNPPTDGFKEWRAASRKKFEAFWMIGSTPRLVYAVGLYLGHRRSDIARVRWSDLDLDGGGVNVVQKKTGTKLWLPLHPNLREAIDATEHRGEYVILNAYGRPYSVKALGMRMADWTKRAGLAPGHTLHGLRKSLGTMLAESGATTKEIMAYLGHSNIGLAELYTRAAEQKRLASSAFKKLAG